MWNRENTLLFIELYKNSEILWYPRHRYYFNKIKKREAWERISSQLNISVYECKKKMNILLSGLRREKAKIRASQERGNGRPSYESSWFAFESLRFLWEKNKPMKKRIPKVEDSSDVDPLRDDPEEQAVSNQSFQPTDMDMGNATQDNGFEQDVPTTEAPSASRWHEDDENSIFGSLVGTKMQNYTFRTRSFVQKEIMDILFKADTGFYDNNTHSFSCVHSPKRSPPPTE